MSTTHSRDWQRAAQDARDGARVGGHLASRFPQHHLRDALRYLELSDEELSRALELLPRLREEIHAAEAPPAS